VPFLDHRLVEWTMSLPDELKIRRGVTKVVLRDAFRDRIPTEILRRGKRGFDLPLAAWIRGPLRGLTERLLGDERLAGWPGLRAPVVRRMLERHLSGADDFGLPLFNLVSVMLFLERHDGATA
jgi:asparagine synthase (glutamine-hydrolysing)